MACHVTFEERRLLYGLTKKGKSPTEIAELMGRHRSTIYRELDRNSGQRGYRPQQAQRLADERRLGSRRPRKMDDPDVQRYGDTYLGVFLAGQTRWARWLREKSAPVMRDHPILAYGAVAMVFLLVLLWSPTDIDRGIWGTLVLAALVALVVWALRRQTLKEFPPASPS